MYLYRTFFFILACASQHHLISITLPSSEQMIIEPNLLIEQEHLIKKLNNSFFFPYHYNNTAYSFTPAERSENNLSPNGLYGFTLIRNRIKVWNLITQEELFVLQSPAQQLSLLTVSPDSRYLAAKVESKRGVVHVWDIKKQTPLYILDPQLPKETNATITTLLMTEDKIIYATLENSEYTKIYIWQKQEKKETPYFSLMHTINAHRGEITTLISCDNGKKIISGATSGSVKIWDTQFGTLDTIFYNSSKHPYAGGKIRLSPNKTILALELETYTLVTQLNMSQDTPITFPKKNSSSTLLMHIFDDNNTVLIIQDNQVSIIDIEQQSVYQYNIPHIIHSCRLTSDGKTLMAIEGTNYKIFTLCKEKVSNNLSLVQYRFLEYLLDNPSLSFAELSKNERALYNSIKTPHIKAAMKNFDSDSYLSEDENYD